MKQNVDLKLEILEGNYWENYKFAKDLALVYPYNHPKRIKIEEEVNIILREINNIKNNVQYAEKEK